ncbi:MAG: divergent PAP2 family protein [Brevinematales bacterium]|nr:divergent PAP2 family protein [Brevinematales bacterium]
MPNDWKFWELLFNKPLVSALAAQLSAQLFKVILPVFKGKPPDFRQLSKYGGIPSGHTAFIVAAAAAIGITAGWTSPVFAIAGTVSAILIYDILKLRTAVECSLEMGQKALEGTKQTYERKIPQFKGHSPVEVIAGIIWGIAVAVGICLLWG